MFTITRRSAIVGALASSVGTAFAVGVPAQARALHTATSTVFYPQISFGDREGYDHPVVVAQYLVRRWVPQLGVDGIFGTASSSAVLHYQIAEHLSVSGILTTRDDWYHLVRHNTSSLGSSGSPVLALQQALTMVGARAGVSLVHDGVYGSRTRDAVVKVQQHLNQRFGTKLLVDGIAGTNTWMAILLHYSA